MAQSIQLLYSSYGIIWNTISSLDITSTELGSSSLLSSIMRLGTSNCGLLHMFLAIVKG